jgi:hypothetical protein
MCGIGRPHLHGARGLAAPAERPDHPLFADLADKYCGGYLRFTSRNNVEFLLDDPCNIEPLKTGTERAGYPVGGTNNASATSCTPRDGSTAIPRPPTLPAW